MDAIPRKSMDSHGRGCGVRRDYSNVEWTCDRLLDQLQEPRWRPLDFFRTERCFDRGMDRTRRQIALASHSQPIESPRIENPATCIPFRLTVNPRPALADGVKVAQVTLTHLV